MKNGFIYPIANFLIKVFEKLNLVQLFKFLAAKLADKNNRDQQKAYSGIAIDLFIVLKWLFVFIVWYSNTTSTVITVLVWYLILANLHTYFYRHVWCDDAFDTSSMTIDRARRRFISLIQAFAFSSACFAYLYVVPYSNHFCWGGETNLVPSSIHSFWYSISNSVTASYDLVKPVTEFGQTISMIQLIITFIFVTIVLSRSIPQSN